MAEEIGRATGLPWERYGHDWTDVEKVREYVERDDQRAGERAETFAHLAAFVPFERAHPLRILDIGAGHGVVAAALLDAFANASAVGLDASEPMMEVALERMAPYGDRFRYYLGDFADGDLPGDLLGPFEVAVSSRAIHHLPAPQKRRLYQAVFQVLTPGGCFFNLDTVAPPDDYLRELYRNASGFLRGRPVDSASPRQNWPGLPGHYYDTEKDHLRFLAEAGFDPVDCFWKRMNNALIGGYKSG